MTEMALSFDITLNISIRCTRYQHERTWHALLLHHQSLGHICVQHDDVIKWKHFPRYWPFVRGIHRGRPVTQSFDVFFDLRLNKRSCKQSWGRRFETLSRPLWRHRNEVFEWSVGFKDRAHLSTFEFFILEKFSCIVVLIVFFVIVQSSGLISVWFRQKMTFFINFISFHIFAIYVGGACWGLPAACRLIAVSGARLPSVDGLTVRYIKNAPLLNLPSKYVCDLFQTCFQYMYVRYKHTGTMLLCLQVALSFI